MVDHINQNKKKQPVAGGVHNFYRSVCGIYVPIDFFTHLPPLRTCSKCFSIVAEYEINPEVLE